MTATTTGRTVEQRIKDLETSVRRAVHDLDDAAGQVESAAEAISGAVEDITGSTTKDRLMASNKDLLKAVHMLHEQAHGQTPLRLCREDPCRDLDFETIEADELTSGPAPLTLPLRGEDH